jgi:hypothetical protein
MRWVTPVVGRAGFSLQIRHDRIYAPYEVGDGAGLAVREQHRVDTLLQARAVADQVQPPARPLPLSAHVRIGQPDRRH